MEKKRYNELMRNHLAELTQDEMAEGWHFCDDWDGLLVGPGMDELNACTGELGRK